MQDRYTGDIGDFGGKAKPLILLSVSSSEILSLILSFEDTNALLIGSGVLMGSLHNILKNLIYYQ